MFSGVRRSVLILAVALAASAVGCSKPCDELAANACERAGESSETCQTIKEKATKASSEDQRACKKALDMVETLSKNK